MMREGKMILTAVAQNVVATFPGPDGKGSRTLYRVRALDENGEPVPEGETLNTFAELPLGEALEYEVELYKHPVHGESWTLKKPRENLTRRVAAMEKQIKDLSDRVAAIEER